MKKRALVVHNDRKVYVIEALDNNYDVERELNKFASLIKIPEGIHTYEIDEYSLWSAAALGMKSDYIISFFENNSKNYISNYIKTYIKDKIKEFWTVDLKYSGDNKAILYATDIRVINELTLKIETTEIIILKNDNLSVVLRYKEIYLLKKFLISINIFINEVLDNLKDISLEVTTELYDYQIDAVDAFTTNYNGIVKGRGVISMPPGSGKTLVGLKVIEKMKVKTLVLLKNKESFDSWKKALREHTNLGENAEALIKYNELNDLISIFTYIEAQKLFDIIISAQWGLVIYDDAHKLPGPKSKVLAYITSKYKLALGSILKREDNKDYIIYIAVGPKVYNITLREMELKGAQIKVICTEVKIPQDYWELSTRNNETPLSREAKNLGKIEVYKLLEERHKNCKIVLVSTFKEVGYKFNDTIKNSTLIDGAKPPEDRKLLVQQFNEKNVCKLIASELLEQLQVRDVDVLISLSYIGKSEREEYLRIGKLKSSNLYKNKIGYYYALVSESTCEESVYKERMQDMIKHGYRFKIIHYSNSNKGIVNNET